MKKKRICLYYITLMLFCQYLMGVGLVLPVSAVAINGNQRAAIVDHCDEMHENLKTVQKKDRQTRVYLGRLYETILNKFLTPLNVRLVENNLSDAGLIENQSKFAEKKSAFTNDYVSYQQALEEAILADCKNEPEKFYDDLVMARAKRKVVSQDVASLRKLVTEQISLVGKLKERL